MLTDMGSPVETMAESASEDMDVDVNMNQPLSTGDVPLFNSKEDYAWMAEWMMFLNVTRQPQEAYKHFNMRICMSAVYHAMVTKGGFDEVVCTRGMQALTKSLGLETNVAQKVKQIYEESLLSFEHFKLRGVSVLGRSGMCSTRHQFWVSEGKGKSQLDRCFTDAVPVDVVKRTMAIAMASPLHNSKGLLKMEFEKAAIIARKHVQQLVGVVNVASVVVKSTTGVASSATQPGSVMAYLYLPPPVACWLVPQAGGSHPRSNVKITRFKRKPNM